MNYAEFVGKYKGLQMDVIIYAYLKALEDLVGEEKVNYYIQSAIQEVSDYNDARKVIDKLTETPKIPASQPQNINFSPSTRIASVEMNELAKQIQNNMYQSFRVDPNLLGR